MTIRKYLNGESGNGMSGMWEEQDLEWRKHGEYEWNTANKGGNEVNAGNQVGNGGWNGRNHGGNVRIRGGMYGM